MQNVFCHNCSILPHQTTLVRIRGWLTENTIGFEELHHKPTRTSEDSARVRGESTQIGAKALLIKVDKKFGLFVLSAELRANSRAIRDHLKARRTRFATTDELRDLTGLVPGSVPPFGEPILPFRLYVDESIRQLDRIAFNAGSLTDSIFLSTEDYFRIAGAEVFSFGVAPEPRA